MIAVEQRAASLVSHAHGLWLGGRGHEAAEAYLVAADACEEAAAPETEWREIAALCRQSAWWCKQPPAVPSMLGPRMPGWAAPALAPMHEPPTSLIRSEAHDTKGQGK